MRKQLIITFGIILLMVSGMTAFTQTTEEPKIRLSRLVANTMKDSLNLSIAQCDSIYQTNVKIQELKMEVWKQYSNRDSIRINIQRIENGRDSLYNRVLTAEQYSRYKQKKVALIAVQ